MNSIEALDYALGILRRHRVIPTVPELASKEAAITTLEALREHIADQEETRSRERAILDDWVERAGAPLKEEA
jgi:hypothetical protein